MTMPMPMMVWRATLSRTLLLAWLIPALSFTVQRQYNSNSNSKTKSKALHMGVFDFFGGSSARIPKSPADRDNQAIAAAKAAIASPRTPSCPLIECEFPPLVALNKLGDGSLQSANQVDKANLDFAVKLLRSIAPLPMMGPQTSLLLSSTATNSFLGRAQKAFQGGTVHSLKDGLPTVKAREVFVLVAPSVTRDYDAARRLVSNGNTVVLVNGFAKDPKTIPEQATMAYFLKPLTYNSQVAGYLTRSYPGKWTCLDATTNAVLGTFTDADILVSGTNTPDLRTAVRQVQKSADARAIRARKS